MAYLAALVIHRAMGWLGRLAGPLLIITIAGSCGFVLGVAVTSALLSP